MTRIERMSDHFTKLHFTVGEFPITLHRFTGPDGGDPHDHPHAFTTTILSGGYIEEVWRRGQEGWSSRLIHRQVGSTHRVGASCIHRIVELPHGECLTSVVWHAEGTKRREPRFYRLRHGVMQSRRWNEPRFRKRAA
ncbi:MAG: hypothetical protein ACRYGA_17155 [Janthinobacterium lividum]